MISWAEGTLFFPLQSTGVISFLPISYQFLSVVPLGSYDGRSGIVAKNADGVESERRTCIISNVADLSFDQAPSARGLIGLENSAGLWQGQVGEAAGSSAPHLGETSQPRDLHFRGGNCVTNDWRLGRLATVLFLILNFLTAKNWRKFQIQKTIEIGRR